MPAEPANGSAKTPRAEAGSIALLALWAVAIISILLAAATFTSRTEVRIAENAVGGSRARLAAEAGTQLGLVHLLQQRAERVTVFDGTPEPWQDGSIRVEISIVDEAGKIDLNNAPLALLAGLFVSLGQQRETALLLACNILDRRGTPDGMCPEPADGNQRSRRLFEVPEELGQLPGFNDMLYDRVADYVTVASGASAIDPRVAARPVLLAIPGATPDLVDGFLENRARWRELFSGDAKQSLLAAASFVVVSPLRDFTIKAVARTAGGARYRADLQVRLTERPKTPYEIIAMRAPPVDRGQRDSASPSPQRRAP
jgi:general secretion pathway protein K